MKLGTETYSKGLEDLQICLHEELGRMIVIPRTQRQLFGKVISLLIVQADLLEEEEESLLPVIRREISQDQQLEMAHRLLFDLDAEEPYWVLDWVAEHLNNRERQELAKLAARMDEPAFEASALFAEQGGDDEAALTADGAEPEMDAAAQKLLDHPIDLMYLIHKGLSADAWNTEAIAERLEIGEDLELFRQAFNSWIHALGFHADMEDTYMTPVLPDSPRTRENEEAHVRLVQRIEDIQAYLQEIGDSPVTTRIRRRLFGKVVALRIEQDDHLEEEEESILPIIRDIMGQEEQLRMAEHLLVDTQTGAHVTCEQPGWVVDGLLQVLTDVERWSLKSLVRNMAAAGAHTN